MAIQGKKRKSAAEKRLEEAQRLEELRVVMCELKDPRIRRCRKHELLDIVLLTLCAVLCGAEGWIAVEQYGHRKAKWLRSFLELPHGIPSHDTIGRVFSALNPEALQRCLQAFIAELRAQQAPGAPSQGAEGSASASVVAIDGKSLRRSMDRSKAQNPLHLLSAFATDSQLVLGQEAVDAKSNEITAIPALLGKLDLQGRTVTLDAMGCQKDVVRQVAEQGGDIVVALKENQKRLFQTVTTRMQDARVGHAFASPASPASQPVMVETGYASHTVGPEKNHGRIETRTIEVIDAQGDWFHHAHPGWAPIRSVICVTRAVTHPNRDTSSQQTRYFLSSHTAHDPAMLGNAIRAHWAIENNLHWTLDTAFREDDCRVRTDHAPENFSLLRKMALALLKADTSTKVGIKNRRLCAGWDDSYLLSLLGITPNHKPS